MSKIESRVSNIESTCWKSAANHQLVAFSLLMLHHYGAIG
jgi:hypothetical protein